MIIYLSPKCLKSVEKAKKTDFFKNKKRIQIILDKSPWDSTAKFIFFCYSRFPLKTVQRFRNFLAVLSSQLRGGVGPVCGIGKRPRNASVPRLLSMIVGLTMGSVRFSLYLILVICVYRSNAHGSLPTYVPPSLIQTTVTRTFAKPVVNLTHVSQRKGPVQMQTGLWSTCKRFTKFQESFRNKPYELQEDSLKVQLSSVLRSLVAPKKFSAAIAEDIEKFFITMDAARKQKLHVHSCSSKT